MKNFDADNFTGRNHTGTHPNTPVRFLTATSIIGDKVNNPEGENMGTIKDIMVDLISGRIEYVVIEFGGFLGMGEKFFAVPFSMIHVDPKNETFVFSKPKEILKNAPGFDKDHWPETNSHEFEAAATYWGDFMGSNTGSVPY